MFDPDTLSLDYFHWNASSTVYQFSLSPSGGSYWFEDDDEPFYRQSRVTFSDVQVQVVPIPPTLALLVGACLALFGLTARRERAQT
jgi:hypothetical protein